MNPMQDARRSGIARRYDYDDRTVLALDLDASDEAVTVDVVDGTAIVVVETDAEPTEHEFDLPGSEATVSINNGVVTIEVNA